MHEPKKRILGDQRIFQAVVNDLNLTHDSLQGMYLYNGKDPYEFEDDAFPRVVAAIEAYTAQKCKEARIDELKRSLNRGYFIPEMEAYAEGRLAELRQSDEEGR